MELQVGVKIAIIRNNKVLLLKRAAGKYADVKVDRWDIVGGRIKPGTPLLENLKREVLEETKMEIVGEAKLVAAQDILKSLEKHVVRLTYVGSTSGEPELDEENEEFKWMDAAALQGLGESLDVFFKELFDKKIIEL